MLYLENLYKKHSGENLANSLISVLKRFNIENSIFSITRDNASNNDTLIQVYKKYSDDNNGLFHSDIRCLAHILNLVVQDILKEIKGNITNEEYSNIDEEVKLTEELTEEREQLAIENEEIESSTKRRRQNTIGDNITPNLLPLPPISLIKRVRLQIYKLRNQQKLIEALSIGIIATKLPRQIRRPQIDIPTRWNSTYTMLDQYIAIRPAIEYTIKQYPEEFINITIKKDEINAIKELIDVLELFNEATIEVQSETKPILMLTILLTTELYNHITTAIKDTK